MAKVNNEKFRTDIKPLLQSIVDDVKEFYAVESEPIAKTVKPDVCKNIAKTSEKVKTLAIKQMNIELAKNKKK